ncbi:hypothetical protein LRS73_31860 [Methylobacterium currus]|uniref:hypothetical protein n=1 Tax=Methylobacterium currus TaxID=2051553 RepID=UPI001E6295E0|nr:hypothetical protein [Methylobacterium currus]UHC19453.1 hypothetical protein LRS73_31860 [Methylobacterium currus]
MGAFEASAIRSASKPTFLPAALGRPCAEYGVTVLPPPCLALAAYLSKTVSENDHHLDEDTVQVFKAVHASAAQFAEASPAAEPDPHVALLPALRQAYAWDRASRPINNTAAMNSFEEEASAAVQSHCWDIAGRIITLPAPHTLAGLGALALALSIQAEEAIGPAGYEEERRHAAAIRAMISVAGVDPLPNWCGFGDEDGADCFSNSRYSAMLDRMGAGSLPAWALAGKSGPDDAPEA